MWLGVWLGALLTQALATSVPTRAATAFAPHRAIYDLSLATARAGGSVMQARGKLEFEWADACTGWTVSQRTRIRLTSAEGEAIEFGWILNSLELKQGTNYRFFIRRFNFDKSTEEVSGEATLKGSGQGGEAVFTAPEPGHTSLPEGTIFPTAHSLLLIETARAGRLPLWRIVFDGSGEDGLFEVNAAMSHALPAGAPLSFQSPLLADQPSWRLHLAYFARGGREAEPEHEQSLRLFANGVVDEMVLDYGDFALRADLELLEGLPPMECAAR